jgi:tetratricopeptide (TPR) repeat protein
MPLLLLGVLAGWPRGAQASPEGDLTGPQLSEADKKRALELYQKGRADYDVGDYDAAIDSFKKAYQISGGALLIFNVAQAYRLKGDCPRALETYRHFVRLGPGSPLRPEADTHIRELAVRCAPPPAPASLVQPTPPATVALTTTPSQPSTWQGRGLTLGLLGSGVVLLGSTAVLAVWNHRRYDRWAVEDRRLSLPPPGGSAQAAEWVDRQNRNDDLLGSVRRANQVTVAVGVTSLVCLLAAGTLPLLLNGHAFDNRTAGSASNGSLAWR